MLDWELVPSGKSRGFDVATKPLFRGYACSFFFL